MTHTERRGIRSRAWSLLLPILLIVPAGAMLSGRDLPAANPSVVPPSATPLPASVHAVFEAHCLGCHDADTRKGGLDLTALPPAFTDGDLKTQWTTVFDRIESGEMPPKSKARLADADRSTALDWIGSGLRGSEKARQSADGRTQLRRLNRVEYENTVHDLLGIDIDLKEMLPEDAIANGFDNQDVGLVVSPVLVERYLEAAEAALDAAIVHGDRPTTTTARYSYLDEGGQIGKAYQLGKYILRLEDAAVFTTEDHPPKILSKFRAPVAGRYRFRISCYTYDNAIQRPLQILVYLGSQSPREGKTFLHDAFDVPFEPQVIEFEDRLEQKDTIRLVVDNLIRQYPKTVKDFKGPGLAVQWVEVEGPLVEQWPPVSHTRLLGNLDVARGTLADAERIIAGLLPRAFRRPTTAADVTPYTNLVAAALDSGANFEQALKIGLKAVLCSPDFLYLKTQPGRLDSYAVASRLSYFLWSSMPDQPLFDAAAAGTLLTPPELYRQVERMLADPRSARFTESFTGQWLSLRQINATTPDAKLYPEFDDVLERSMVRETTLFFEEILRNDLSLLNFIDSDFAMLNSKLATHYGIDGIDDLKFRKVKLPHDSVRGGVMTQAAVLKVTANGTNTSPVLRGVWVLDHLLGKPSPPPPQNVPAVEPDIRGATSIREQFAKHRELGACASCHVKIDPPGYALENFDVIGGWRSNYRKIADGFKDRVKDRDGNSQPYAVGLPVEAGDTLADGRAFRDVREFKQLLLSDKDAIASAMAQKLLVYGTGHGLEFSDRDALREIVRRTATKNHGFRTLLHEVVQSPVFLSK